ncbi:F0F1 ATP synthase subunit delta [Ideonella sp. B7]|uniref:F0F1 ATP synthase subunit delta n=1 Tax=Ideonella benzenivorans TaxID=2831643 RepID=UPI001CECFD15|nr:F0F1 ATP synthase subunit delta [Ideonella benzenivorans]MCA6215236.1 F0F1 ATP synthase subunit delta [Ideonella benzenivorans]
MAELATIARPYAEAVFQVARKGDLKGWLDQIEALGLVAQDAQLRQFAEDPKVTPEQVLDVIVAALKAPALDGVRNLLRTLVENGRLAALPDIAAQFRALVNAEGGVSDAVIQSAYPIDAGQLAEIVATLEKRFGRKLSASVALDPELIGGIRVVVGDEVLDTSVKARLEQMKVSLTA